MTSATDGVGQTVRINDLVTYERKKGTAEAHYVLAKVLKLVRRADPKYSWATLEVYVFACPEYPPALKRSYTTEIDSRSVILIPSTLEKK